MNPAQNAPLTRSPRGNDGDDGDGADSSAWIENKKEDRAMSSEEPWIPRLNRYRPTSESTQMAMNSCPDLAS